MGLRRRASSKKVNKIIKRRVEVARALKSKRITNTAGVIVVFEVMLEFLIEL